MLKTPNPEGISISPKTHDGILIWNSTDFRFSDLQTRLITPPEHNLGYRPSRRGYSNVVLHKNYVLGVLWSLNSIQTQYKRFWSILVDTDIIFSHQNPDFGSQICKLFFGPSLIPVPLFWNYYPLSVSIWIEDEYLHIFIKIIRP